MVTQYIISSFTINTIIWYQETLHNPFQQLPTLPDTCRPLTLSDTSNTSPNIIRHFLTFSDISRHFPTLSNNIRHFLTLSNNIQQYPTFSDIFQHYPTFSDIIRLYPTFSTVGVASGGTYIIESKFFLLTLSEC